MSHRSWSLALSLALSCLPVLTASAAWGQTSSDATSDTRGKMPTAADKKAADERFVKASYSGNLLHVRASEYALTQVNDPKVRALAERLIADHTEANQKLARVVTEMGMQPSNELLPPHKAMLEQAMMVKGEQFAATYLFNMASLHVHDVLETAHAANEATDASVKAFATAALPILKEHLKVIRPMAEAKAGMTGLLGGM